MVARWAPKETKTHETLDKHKEEFAKKEIMRRMYSICDKAISIRMKMGKCRTQRANKKKCGVFMFHKKKYIK